MGDDGTTMPPALPEKGSVAPPTPTADPAPVFDPACYFIVHNIAKKHNVGTIARCATAFGAREVVLIGSKQYNAFGSQGADAHVTFSHYDSLHEASEKLRRDKGVTKIIGVEITPSSVPIETHPFDGPTAFICGNEGDGMSDAQKAICDGFVYIKQHGPGTASLNVAVSASLVMHHFSLWASYPERERRGEKYVVAPPPMRTHKRGTVGEDPEEVRKRRAAKRAEREATEEVA